MNRPTPSPDSDLIANLPIAAVVEDVKRALQTGNVLLHAPPGAGKSTGLPLALLAGASSTNKILMLEPRRLAAIGVAERLAAQLGERLGQTVGLRMRGQTSVSAHSALEVVTEGVLTRMLQADPMLDGVSVVIFDEFHERSLNADLGLALCREVQQELRPDLRLLLMSATLDAIELGAALAPIQQIHCAGKAFPVDILWRGDSKETLTHRISATITKALAEQPGDILVFLPGIAEIEKTADMVAPRLDEQTRLFKLHGRADSKTQRAATAPASEDSRRVILCTSIAETSLTIDGVRVVIDAGLERRGRVDPHTGAARLETVMASQASATQRTGRAGRTAPGTCYRLWSQTSHSQRALSWQPEILRAELSPILVETGQWGAREIQALPWLDVPPAASVTRAETLLGSLGIWRQGRLSDHGAAVAQLPVHPRLGHMLIWAAEHGATELACKLAVLLEDGGAKSNTADLDDHIRQALPRNKHSRVSQLRKQLDNIPSKSTEASTPSLAVLVAHAFPDWVARRRPGADAKYQLSCGGGAYLPSVDPLAQTQWLAIASLGGASKEARIFLACSLDMAEFEAWAPDAFAHHKELGWDDRRERVVAEDQKLLGKLLVESKPTRAVNADEKARALLAGIRKRGIDCLPWTEACREWQARVQLLARFSPHQASNSHSSAWPKVDDASLLASTEHWLLAWLNGLGSLKAVAQLDLLSILSAMLDYHQQQMLKIQAPERFRVPSGSNVKLRYAGADTPVLSVKLQEMFGCAENPAIANGQLNLKVELLSPARRPVQLTADLANFWTNSYPAVKKDLAGRYPKHDWPDDPLNATPTAYAKTRRKKSEP